MTLRSRVLLCLLPLLSAHAYSQDSGDGNAGAVADAEARFRFINLLEFIGEFETEDGDWISPDILDDEAFVDLDGPGGVAAQRANDTRERRTDSVNRNDE